MAGNLRVGGPMWAHPPWVGRYLSPSGRGRELADYARWCNAVEGNTTFYAIPSPETVQRWAELAPSDFRFAFKVPRSVTHDRRLHRDALAEVHRFLDRIEPLGDRVGPIQIQLPPSFGPDGLPVLRTFVGRLPRSRAWVVELRHRAFFDGSSTHRAVDGILERCGVGRVILDTRPLYSIPARSDAAVEERRSKPALPVVTDLVGTTPVVRLIGADVDETTWDGLRAWSGPVRAWLAEGREPYVFVHQPTNLTSPDLARRFHAAVAESVPGLDPLPEPPDSTPSGEIAGQATLF